MIPLQCLSLLLAIVSGDFPADELLSTIKTRSVHRHKINWNLVEPEIKQRLKEARSDVDKAKVIVSLLARMDDVHTSLMHQNKYYAHFEGVDQATYQKLKPQTDRQRQESGKVIAQMLDGSIAYVRVPAFHVSGEGIQQAASQLHDQVLQLAEQKPKGWIVDLRLNGGGNVYPMLLGLQPLLGNEVVGGTIDADKKSVHQWVLKNDGLYWRDTTGDRQFASRGQAANLSQAKAPVAVLVGPLTASSGQATALAFKHRPKTKLIGEPTAKGYCTVNTPFTVGSVSLNLAVGYMADRQGNAYESIVLPEESVEGGDDYTKLRDDHKVKRATLWLKDQ
jgi:carboxyl-terminal processing protease